MTPADDFTRDPKRLGAALRLVLRRYGRQIRLRPRIAVPAIILPGIADVLIFYGPPLVVARVLTAFAQDRQRTAADLWPYIAVFAGVWLAGEVVWRLAIMFMTRVEIRGMESLYIEAMDELLAKDLAFFHDNFAGSLTKRALGYARRFEDVFDVLCFSVSANVIPLIFAAVVLWWYSPLLILVLLGLMGATFAIVFPLIRRRQRLVDDREAASNVLAGHVADSIANAETVRAFAREREEARIHSRNVLDLGVKTMRSWDYQNLRVDTVTAPMHVLTNTLGLIVALATSQTTGVSLEAVFITFSYYTTATRVMVQSDLSKSGDSTDRRRAVHRAAPRAAVSRGHA
jgi:ATP-binding cassette subfamily B protein